MLLAHSLSRSIQRKLLIRSLVDAAGIVAVLFVVSLTGARSFAASILLAIVLSFLLSKGLPIKPFYIVLAAITVLVFPTVFTILREGRVLTVSDLQYYMFGPIARRVFVDPMRGGLWHVHYGQTVEFFGLAGIPKLAVLFGVEPVNVPNIIGLRYEKYTLETVNSNASYVFSYFSYFGLISFPFSLIALWLLDLALWVYGKLSDSLLLACVSAVSVSCIGFVSSDYTTVLLTHGILVSLMGALIVDRLSRIRIRGGFGGATGSLQKTGEALTQPRLEHSNE